MSPSTLQGQRSVRTKSRTKSQCIPLLFYSLFRNRRVNNFINHITWHDAPKFIVYRNTLNRTQGFTMDTQLTVLPIALTTVNDSFKIFCFSFFPPFGCSFVFFFFVFWSRCRFRPFVLLLADLQIVGQWHSTLQMLWRPAGFCFTSTI